jgi:hypothetical protein
MIRPCAFVVALAFVPGDSAGQTPATRSPDAQPAAPESSIEATVQALVRTIESQQKLLEEQGRQIEQLRREIAETRALTRPVAPGVMREGAMKNRVFAVSGVLTLALILSPLTITAVAAPASKVFVTNSNDSGT